MKNAQDNIVRLDLGCEVRASADARSFDVIASTSAVDAMGEIVVQDWNLARYAKNPIVLYGHDSYSFPIGRASNVRVEEKQLRARIHLASEKANPKAEQVYQLMSEGVLRAISVGFKPTTRAMQTIEGKDVLTLLGNELLELSVVPIGANPEAVAVSKAFRASVDALPTVARADRPWRHPYVQLGVEGRVALFRSDPTRFHALREAHVRAQESFVLTHLASDLTRAELQECANEDPDTFAALTSTVRMRFNQSA